MRSHTDSIGHRQTSNTSAGETDVPDHYVNSLNQYISRESNPLHVGGTAAPNAKIVAAGNPSTLALAGRAGRHWGDNILVANSAQPFAGSILFYSAILGGGPARLDRDDGARSPVEHHEKAGGAGPDRADARGDP